MAGRPRKHSKRIESVDDERLHWFSLRAYSSLAKLSPLGLYFQIALRRHVFKEVDGLNEYLGDIQRYRALRKRLKLSTKVALIKKNPIVTLQHIRAHRLSISKFFSLEWFLLDANPYPVCIRNLGEEQPSYPLPEHSIRIEVDLSYTDSVLKEEFTDLLAQARSESLLPPRTVMNAPELSSLAEYSCLRWKPILSKNTGRGTSRSIRSKMLLDNKILPYLDLRLWEEISGYEVSDETRMKLIDSSQAKSTVEENAWKLIQLDATYILDLQREAAKQLAKTYHSGAKNRKFIPPIKYVIEKGVSD